MCCLFGMIDYGNVLSKRQRERVIKCLATESMVRGRDATGIAYLHDDSINIFKKPLPANKMYFHLPADANTVMGHTRLTTQGSEKSNYRHSTTISAKNRCFGFAKSRTSRGEFV